MTILWSPQSKHCYRVVGSSTDLEVMREAMNKANILSSIIHHTPSYQLPFGETYFPCRILWFGEEILRNSEDILRCINKSYFKLIKAVRDHRLISTNWNQENAECLISKIYIITIISFLMDAAVSVHFLWT